MQLRSRRAERTLRPPCLIVPPLQPRQIPAQSRPRNKASRGGENCCSVCSALLVVAALVFGIPWIRAALSTVSTDDAYVNGHVTFVAPRVAGPGFPRSGGRQQPRAQGRSPRRTGQGAVPGRGRGRSRRRSTPRRRTCRRPRRRCAAIEAQAMEPALATAARRGGRRQPGRPAARPGRRARQEQGRARAGAAGIRPGATAGRAGTMCRARSTISGKRS